MIRKFIKNLLPPVLLNYMQQRTENVKLNDWYKKGRPVPPPHRHKQLVIQTYQKQYGISTFVETGTYLGDMVNAQLKNFETIYSIELGLELYENAVQRFKKWPYVKILHGDSGKVLVDLVPSIKCPAIFWLDGHYSAGITAKGDKECPIYEELNEIFKSIFPHIILIDDARCFNGSGDYPTIKELKNFIENTQRKSLITIEDDIIKIEIKSRL